MRQYSDPGRRFTISFPAYYSVSESSETSAGVRAVAFGDLTSTKANGQPTVGIDITASRLPHAVSATDVPGLKPAVDRWFASRMESLDSPTVLQQPKATELNGVPGYMASYSYTADRLGIIAVTYILFKGRYQYEATALANQMVWDAESPRLRDALSTFSLR
jgi:hypothetical protein